VIRVYIADALPQERLALRLILLDMNMEIAGESEDWLTTFAQVPICSTDMLVADWALLPQASNAPLAALRRACPKALVIVLVNGVEVRRHAAISAGADGFISRGELPERVTAYLRAAVAKIQP
jgi:DNA-binding NarL/FixJ family response regulator